MPHPPAGWYPDPTASTAQPPTLRYWDGAGWTQHVAPVPVAMPAAPTYTMAAPTTPDGEPLAGWGWRALAHLVDVVLIWVVTMVVTLPAQMSMQARMNRLTAELEGGSSTDFGAFWAGWFDVMRDQMLWQLPVVVMVMAYFAAMLRGRGATVGKLVVGLRVRLRERPGRLPWSAVLLRVLAVQGIGALPLVALVFGGWGLVLVLSAVALVYGILDPLWPLWDSRRQAIHDKIAGTNVVRVR